MYNLCKRIVAILLCVIMVFGFLPNFPKTAEAVSNTKATAQTVEPSEAYPNMLTAGRSAAGAGYGWDLLRVIPPAILTGQAAGEAACLALREGVGAWQVNIKNLQGKLERENVMIHFPDEYLPEDRTVIIHGKNAAEIEGGHN